MGQPLTGRDIEIINESFENMSRGHIFIHTYRFCSIFFIPLSVFQFSTFVLANFHL